MIDFNIVQGVHGLQAKHDDPKKIVLVWFNLAGLAWDKFLKCHLFYRVGLVRIKPAAS